MSTTEQQTAIYQLKRAVMDDAYELYAEHPWFWEGARWNELLFAIAARVSGIEEAAARVLITELNELDLIDLKDLAALPRAADGKADSNSPAFKALAETMTRYAVDENRVHRTVTAFSDAAVAFDRGFDGKVQKYLRHYGERILGELDEHFRFTDLTEDETGDAFTEWLQNCLAMPLSLRDADMKAFCEARGITVEALIEAADAADINVAYLDDITQAAVHAVRSREEEAAAEPAPQIAAAGQGNSD